MIMSINTWITFLVPVAVIIVLVLICVVVKLCLEHKSKSVGPGKQTPVYYIHVVIWNWNTNMVPLSHKFTNKCERLVRESEQVMSTHVSLACVLCHTREYERCWLYYVCQQQCEYEWCCELRVSVILIIKFCCNHVPIKSVFCKRARCLVERRLAPTKNGRYWRVHVHYHLLGTFHCALVHLCPSIVQESYLHCVPHSLWLNVAHKRIASTCEFICEYMSLLVNTCMKAHYLRVLHMLEYGTRK